MFGRLSVATVFLGVALAIPVVWRRELERGDHGAAALAVLVCAGLGYLAIALTRWGGRD
jgi:hypothetical protein